MQVQKDVNGQLLDCETVAQLREYKPKLYTHPNYKGYITYNDLWHKWEWFLEVPEGYTWTSFLEDSIESELEEQTT